MTLEVYLNNILIQGESEKVEFKSSFNKEVIETIVAFANKSGGVKLFAVTTVDDLLNNTYHSNPRNKLIADLFKDLGHIEKYGSGIKRIVNLFKNENLPMPEFKNISGGFMVTVFSKNNNDTLNDRQKKIINIILSNKNINLQEIANLLNVGIAKVKRDIDYLREYKILKRVGGKKSVIGK